MQYILIYTIYPDVYNISCYIQYILMPSKENQNKFKLDKNLIIYVMGTEIYFNNQNKNGGPISKNVYIYVYL